MRFWEVTSKISQNEFTLRSRVFLGQRFVRINQVTVQEVLPYTRAQLQKFFVSKDSFAVLGFDLQLH